MLKAFNRASNELEHSQRELAIAATVRSEARAPAPRLRQASLLDYPRILSLMDRHGFTPRRTFDEWQHLWASNPAYEIAGRRWPIGWVLEAGDRIVGHIGNIPSIYQFCGRQLLCASGYAWVVEKAYRGYSLYLLDHHYQQENVALVMSNTANSHAYDAHVQLAAKPVPVGLWDESAVWITTYSSLLADWFGRRNIPAASGASHLAAIVLYTRDTPNRLQLAARARRGCDLEWCNSFDESFDTFWHELRHRYAGKLLAVRSRATLEWHFKHAIEQKRIWIITSREKTRLRAYAVFVLRRNSDGDPIQRLYLADFQSLERDDKLYSTVLKMALNRCRRAGIHMLSAMGYSASGTDTSTLSPYRIKQPNWKFLYKAADAQLAADLTDQNAWSPSLYDGEASL